MQRQLNEKIGEVAETVKQMAQFMMGRSAEGRLQGKKGPVTLSDSLRDAIVAGVKKGSVCPSGWYTRLLEQPLREADP